MAEIESIMESYYRGLSKDERRRIENEVSDKMEEYATEKMRDMEITGIVKVGLKDMKIMACFQVKDNLFKSYPDAKMAHLKDGGNFPFLSRNEEVNMHLMVNLLTTLISKTIYVKNIYFLIYIDQN